MTIETKMLKPIKELNFDKLKEIVNKYREIKDFPVNELLPFEIVLGDDFIFCDDWLQDKIVGLLNEKLEILENELNLLGYTFEDEPKEWQYHVNIVKGVEDE